MRIMDYHMHTNFSADGKMVHEEAVKAAISRGISDICFTEHMDLGHHMDCFNCIPDFKGMQEEIGRLCLSYPEITIGHGLELGYIADYVAQMKKAMQGQSFDYVLLSTHCVEGLDCYSPEAKRGWDKETFYTKYLDTLYQSVCDERLLENYDCVGHIGYVAKCRHYEDNELNYNMFPETFDKILKTIISHGKGIEVNTSGIKKAGHLLPHASIIKRYHELGGKIITIGSDAHNSDRVGEYVFEAMRTIKACGFDKIALFQKREISFSKIIEHFG